MAKEQVCTQCGWVGKPRVRNRGSFVLLMFLFLFFIIPGVFYLMWMLGGHVHTCKSCGAEDQMVPKNSLVARRILAENYP